MHAILLLKAAIPGGAAADLFAQPVLVEGHVREGKFVAPYFATRQKARPAAAATPDLFSPRPQPASKPPAATQEPARNPIEVRLERLHARRNGLPEPALVPPPASPPKPSAPRELAAQAEAETKRRTTQAAKLRELADKDIAEAQADEARDRNTNTHRRARMAAGAIARAHFRQRIAETMKNLADAIDHGEAKHLAGVSSRAAVEALDSALRQAKYAAVRARNGGSLPEREMEAPITADDIRHASLPREGFDSYSARKAIEAADLLGAKRGHAEALGWLRTAERMPDMGGRMVPDDTVLAGLRALAKSMEGKIPANLKSPDFRQRHAAADARRFADRVKDISTERNRFDKLGIRTDLDLQLALTEYVIHRGGARTEDPIKKAERALVGFKGIDFFPTPPALVARLVDEAGIRPGMRVLEPSAGKGDIADALRSAGAEVDTVELGEPLRRLLEAKGHHLVGGDFDQFDAPAGGYDRVVMNPPFSADAEHVRRAFDMLKPGGRLVAIVSRGLAFRQDGRASGFRGWVDGLDGSMTDLPEGSFRSAFRPTGVATTLVVLDKPAQATAPMAPAAEAMPDSAPASPSREGETKTVGSTTYVLRNHRWHVLSHKPDPMAPPGGDNPLPPDPTPELLEAARGHAASIPEAGYRHHAVGGFYQGVYDLPGNPPAAPGDGLGQARDAVIARARAAGAAWAAQQDGIEEAMLPAAPAAAPTPPEPPPARHPTFRQAVDAFAAETGGGAFTPQDVLDRWRGGDMDAVLDHLHGDAEGYAMSPTARGGRWWRAADYLAHPDRAGEVARLEAAIADPSVPEAHRARLKRQIRMLADAMADQAAKPMPAEPGPAAQAGDASPWQAFARPDEYPMAAAVRAHDGNSMTPDRAAAIRRDDFVRIVNSVYESLHPLAETPAQKDLLAAEMAALKRQYLVHEAAVLGARSRTLNSFVTGRAGFNFDRNRKRMAAEQSRADEMAQWLDRARRAIRERLAGTRTADQVRDDLWKEIRRELVRDMATVAGIDAGAEGYRGFDRAAFVNSAVGRLKRLADKGETALVQRALDFIREGQAKMPKPLLTERHGAWKLGGAADETAAAVAAAPTGEETVALAGGARVVRNHDLGRVQILFPGKPPEDTRAKLRGEGWRWSPSNSAWQRMMTDASVASAKRLIGA